MFLETKELQSVLSSMRKDSPTYPPGTGRCSGYILPIFTMCTTQRGSKKDKNCDSHQEM